MKRIWLFALWVIVCVFVIVMAIVLIRIAFIEQVDTARLVSSETQFLTLPDKTVQAYHVFAGSSDDLVVLVGGLGAWRNS